MTSQSPPPLVRRDHGNERGAALVMVLWLCMIVSLLAGAFSLTVTTEGGRQSARVRAAQARAALDTVLAAALIPDLSASPTRRQTARVSKGTLRLTQPAGRATWVVQDQAGLIDLNRVPVERLYVLLPPLAGHMATPILHAVEERRAASRPFLSVQELAGIPGMPAGLHWHLSRFLTVHHSAGTGKIAVRAAPSDLLEIWPDLSSTDRGLLRNLGPDEPLNGEIVRRLNRAGLSVNARPSPFRAVHIQVELESGAAAEAEVLVWLNADAGAPFRILEWRPVGGDGR